mgnify:CR=1 FL=1
MKREELIAEARRLKKKADEIEFFISGLTGERQQIAVAELSSKVRDLRSLQKSFEELIEPLPPAEGAKKVQWSGYGELGNISQKPLQPTAEGAEEVAQRCPVCGGNGLVPNGFYLQTGGTWLSSSLAPETCRACNGTGVILPSYLYAPRLAEKMMEEKDDLQKLMNDISEWSDETFGSGQRNPAIVYHLKKEVDELIAAIDKTNTLGGDPSVGVGEFGRQRTVTRVEYADCLMLLLDSAHHFGISAKELLSVTRGKLEINKVRKWGKPDENGVVEHIE